MRAIATSLTILFSWAVIGQGSVPMAVLDTNAILIGQQVHLDLSITYRTLQGVATNVVWPLIGDTLTSKIQVTADSGVDTVRIDGADPLASIQRRRITLTSFDSGYWAIPPFTFVVNGDSAETSPLLLTVNTVEVDTSQAFRDIKEIYELPFSWQYWLRQNWPYIAGGLAVLAVLVLVIREVKRRRREIVPVQPEAPPQPLHVRTLLALEAVEKRKLWQQGLVKQHHSEVTDILRAYIEERFSVPALERTTDELMIHLKLSTMDQGHREQVRNLLQLADMVKFAKWNPSPTENEEVLTGAIRVVQGTTQHATHAA